MYPPSPALGFGMLTPPHSPPGEDRHAKRDLVETINAEGQNQATV